MHVFWISILALVAYYVSLKLKHLYLKKKWGCEKPYYVPTKRWLGWGFFEDQKQLHKSGRLLEAQLEQFRNTGKHTVSYRVFTKTPVFTCNGENIKTLLATQFNNFSIGVRQHALRPLIGHGIFSSEGDKWKTSREMLRPQFSREQIAHIQSLEPHFQKSADVIRAQKQVELQGLFHMLTLDASSEFLFGESTNTLGTEPAQGFECFANNFNCIQDTMTQRISAGSLYWTVTSQEFKDQIAQIHNATRYYVEKALATPQDELDKKSKDGYIFLYQLVKQTRDPKTLQDELLSILLAGRNTTASLLSFLFLELSRNQRVWEKLKSEVYAQFGDGNNVKFDEISFETMKRCTYLKYCINETLRIHPPISRNLRVAKVDTCLPRGGGSDGEAPLFVSKGTPVIMMIHCAHRNPQVYGKDVDDFRPERWENLKPGWNFMPFGSGPRVCLGQQFALTEASYITIRLLQTFPNLQTVPSNEPIIKDANTTIRIRGGFEVVLS